MKRLLRRLGLGACISCGVPLGATHLPSCAFKTLGCAS